VDRRPVDRIYVDGRHIAPTDRGGPLSEIPAGTLDLLVLKTLHTLGPLHGYGIARRLEQMADGTMRLSQGSIYPALIRLEQRGWIAARWGLSETNRRVKVYTLTKGGSKRLDLEVAQWAQSAALVTRVLEAKA
jgi:PadR family transcriptional regulator PadR